MVAIPGSLPARCEPVRTAIVPVMLSGADYGRAHDAHHIAAGLWGEAVDWVHAEWKAKHNPGKYGIRAFLSSLPREQRLLHVHTTEAIGYGLYEPKDRSVIHSPSRRPALCFQLGTQAGDSRHGR